MNTVTRLGILLCAAALAAGCSTITSGTPRPAGSAPATAAKPTNSATTPPAPPSDETQIRESVKEFQDAYNTQNWDVYLEVMCAPMRARFTPSVMDYLRKDRARTGVTTMTITAVTIDGDNATASFDANNEVMGAGHASLPLKHEDEGWRICQPYP